MRRQHDARLPKVVTPTSWHRRHDLELITLRDLVLLAEMFGPDSTATRVLDYARTLNKPLIYWAGRKIAIYDAGIDATNETLVMHTVPGAPPRRRVIPDLYGRPLPSSPNRPQDQ